MRNSHSATRLVLSSCIRNHYIYVGVEHALQRQPGIFIYIHGYSVQTSLQACCLRVCQNQEIIEDGKEVVMDYYSTEKMVVDGLTKPLAGVKHVVFVNMCSLS